jgi:hypothetical protein
MKSNHTKIAKKGDGAKEQGINKGKQENSEMKQRGNEEKKHETK